MKTLSNDITVNVDTSGLNEGYVNTTIYAKGIGVFSGQSYILGDGNPLAINLNDIACQNRGKDDYLKLNDNGVLESLPLRNGSYGSQTIHSRFVEGQIGSYSATISDGNVQHNSQEWVLTGYDYPDRDIRPSMVDNDYDSELGRIMQGCNWYRNHDDERGVFRNLLIPHFPNVATQKYGLGLQLYIEERRDNFALRTSIGNDVILGFASNKSNMTFMTLQDVRVGMGISYDHDTSIYLKLEGSSGDEFGDWEEAYEYYPGNVTITGIKETRYVSGSISGQSRFIYRGNARFETALQEYNDAAKVQLDIPEQYNTLYKWDIHKITTDANTPVYQTYTRTSESATQDRLDEFISYYESVFIRTVGVYTYRYELLFGTGTSTVSVPDMYYGTCPIAIIDVCYSRYYLAWNDRYGDILSQPFDGKIEFSEEIKTDEIKDYKLRRRVSHKAVQPKWKLNTKWLPEDIYPMYEAIFTSPYVLLYDSQTDRAWNVIVTTSEYKEKTHKTEKSLFNLEIEVEANKTENYIF